MSFGKRFFYLLRKYPLYRAVLAVIVVAVLLFLTVIVPASAHKVPHVTAISPQVGNPGDELTVYGIDFGDEKEDSYVEIGESRLTSSACLDWSDTKIVLKLPLNVRDGLLYVVTRGGRSEPKIFTNKTIVPVPVLADPKTAQPYIWGTNESSQSVGELVTVNGSNFGLMRGTSRVFFTWAGTQEAAAYQTQYIACDDTDYEYWSDTTVRVRVPDGATSGSIYIETEKGESNNCPFTVTKTAGTKTFAGARTFVLDVFAEVNNIVTEETEDASIVLRIPLPPVTPAQRGVEVASEKTESALGEIASTLVHIFDTAHYPENRFSQKHTFVIDTYETLTTIDEKTVKPYTNRCLQQFASALKNDAIVPSTTEDVTALAKKIIGKEKNPYRKAKLIYNHMISSFTVLDTTRTNDVSVLDLLSTKTGDAYDFAMVYCALLRAASVPALPVSGVLVDSTMKAKPHWWCEFYIENFGWVPVDCALGAGLAYEAFTNRENPSAYYFGNLDSQHIVFSRGMNSLRATMVNSKIVYRPRSYALQSIWEESSENVQSYSSYWINPTVTGVY